MILRLLTFPVDSFMWVVEQVEERALAELDRQQNLQKKLMSLQIRFDVTTLTANPCGCSGSPSEV